jgi:hypothetical protein
MEPLDQADLDHAECDIPGCPCMKTDRIYLHAACHPRKGVTASYWKGRGILMLCCRVCGGPVCQIKVAKHEPLKLIDPDKKALHEN